MVVKQGFSEKVAFAQGSKRDKGCRRTLQTGNSECQYPKGLCEQLPWLELESNWSTWGWDPRRVRL